MSRLMPGSSTASQSSCVLLGALTSTRLAPASRWAWAPARVRRPSRAIDHQVDAERLPVRQGLHRVEVRDFAAADGEAAVFRVTVLGPAAVVGVDLEERCQRRDVLDVGDRYRHEQIFLECHLHQRAAIRPKP